MMAKKVADKVEAVDMVKDKVEAAGEPKITKIAHEFVLQLTSNRLSHDRRQNSFY